MKRNRIKIYRNPLPWLAPMIFMLGLFYLYPMFDVIRLSLTNTTILEPDFKYTIDSYIRILEDKDFHHTFLVTLIFVFSLSRGP